MAILGAPPGYRFQYVPVGGDWVSDDQLCVPKRGLTIPDLPG